MNKLFKVWEQDGELQREVTIITGEDTYSTMYDKFLRRYHLTDIEENEDFIPMQADIEIIIVLSSSMFDLKDELLEYEALDFLESIFYSLVRV